MSGTESTTHDDGPPRRRAPLIAAVAAVVLIAGGGGVWLATAGPAAGSGTGGTSGGASDAKSGTAAVPAPPPSSSPGDRGTGGIAPSTPSPAGGVVYRARGELPDGPDRAPVHRAAGTVSRAEVARLAEALGMAGAPAGSGGQWTVGPVGDGSEPVLRVETAAPGSWTYERAPRGHNCSKGKPCPPPAAESGNGRAVDERAARRAAEPVLRAVGQSGARLGAAQTIGSVRVVNADPVIGGLPTYGWATDLQIGPDGRVVRGVGQLKAPVKGEEYPVHSAGGTLERLNARSGGNSGASLSGCAGRLPQRDVPCGPAACASAVPLEGEQRGARPAEDPCGTGGAPAAPAEPKEIPVTGAWFGLSAQYADGRATLVPSWMFRAEPGGGRDGYTVAEPAVEPSLLREPTVPPAESGGASIESYSTEGRSLTVTFWGGVCGEYGAEAEESADRVAVRIVPPEPEPDEVCIAVAKELRETVTLERPLGDREVVDAESGRAVGRSAG
ncbi:hypothetical protein [Streptomyces sp. NPDC001985]|uniref:hypothetical protein n=1 Tax=Streptomyces sp. NPDC001985 TaxID=3154406 RepID=UPI00332BB9F4